MRIDRSNKYISFGDISETKFWISFKLIHWAWWRWWLSFDPTYNGTIRGIHIGIPFLIIIGHQRDINATANHCNSTICK